MRVFYHITIEDVVAFNQFHWHNSPTVRRRWAFAIWTPTVLLLFAAAVTAYFSVLDNSLIAIAVSMVLFALGWPLVFPSHNRRVLERQVRALYREGANRGILGPHELELTETHLIEKNPCGETTRILEAIDRVALGDGHAFIYLSAMSAHIVPRREVEEGDFQAFIGELEKAMSKARDLAKIPRESESITAAPRFRGEFRSGPPDSF